MAHFAELDGSNVVLRVCVVDNNNVPSDKHVDGETWCTNFWGGTWKQTSYNSTFRKRFAGIGYTYDAAKDMFINPKPYASWTLSSNGDWEAPVTRPTDTEEGGLEVHLEWDEENNRWKGNTYTNENPSTETQYLWDGSSWNAV